MEEVCILEVAFHDLGLVVRPDHVVQIAPDIEQQPQTDNCHDSLAGLNVMPKDYMAVFFNKYQNSQLILIDTAMRVKNVYRKSLSKNW